MTDITKDWPSPLPDTLPGHDPADTSKVLTDIYTAAGGQGRAQLPKSPSKCQRGRNQSSDPDCLTAGADQHSSRGHEARHEQQLKLAATTTADADTRKGGRRS